MTAISRFEDIEAWKTARRLTNSVYAHTNKAGFSKDFGLRDQIRRASVSVMSNIAEGFESRTDVQFINFLGVAIKSTSQTSNSKKHTRQQKPAPARLPTLSNISNPILALVESLMILQNMKPSRPDFRLLTFDKSHND